MSKSCSLNIFLPKGFSSPWGKVYLRFRRTGIQNESGASFLTRHPGSGNSTLGAMPQRNGCRDLNRYLYPHAHSSNIHSTQRMEIIQVVHVWMNEKQNVVCTYNRILFDLKKERDSGTCYNMNEL